MKNTLLNCKQNAFKPFLWSKTSGYFKSYSSSSHYDRDVRVRFAPSPTGFLHLGSIRTAFVNYMFAKKHGGKFLLRIEDTDQKRLVPGAIDKIQEALEWSGLIPDEGPYKEGSYGPYIQSQRLSLYQNYVNQLLKEDKAYRCFCSELTLDIIRREAMKNRVNHRYDNRCRSLTKEDIEERLAKGEKYAVRFKLNQGAFKIEDLVMGNINIDLSETESDFVILKSDGYPTYHLANVVDDYHMKISHVFRGIEWLHSTPKHYMLYKALGFESQPLYGHLPLIMNIGGGKLSKRNDHVNIQKMREQGMYEDSILNYLGSLGGGFASLNLSRNNENIYSLEQLLGAFDWKQLRNTPAKLDNGRLLFFNNLSLQKKIDHDLQKVALELITKVKQKYLVQIETHFACEVLKYFKGRVNTINEIVDGNSYLFEQKIIIPETIKQVEHLDKILKHIISLCESAAQDVLVDQNLEIIKKFCIQNEISYNRYMQSWRILVTGKKEGLPIKALYELLKKNEMLKRLRIAMENLSMQ